MSRKGQTGGGTAQGRGSSTPGCATSQERSPSSGPSPVDLGPSRPQKIRLCLLPPLLQALPAPRPCLEKDAEGVMNLQ